MGVFVRGLWGDLEVPRLEKVKNDVRLAASNEFQPTPVVGFAYSEPNVTNMRELGGLADVVKLSDSPLVDWHGRGERMIKVEVPRYPSQRRSKLVSAELASVHLPFGVSIWRHKLECIKAAFKHAEAVCWLDWDCRLVRPLPDTWWHLMSKGKPFQAALTTYKKPKAHWRPGPFGVISRHQVPCGSLVYCRDPKIIDRMIEIQDQNPDWYDEQVYAKWVDEDCGGWFGPDCYYKAGYSPDNTLVHRAIHIPRDPVFYAPLRIWKYTKPETFNV